MNGTPNAASHEGMPCGTQNEAQTTNAKPVQTGED